MENILENVTDKPTNQGTEERDSSPEKRSNESALQSLSDIREQNHIVNAETVRHNLFLQAGITHEKLAHLVQLAVETNEAMLEAWKWSDGTKQPDNSARNRAIENIYDLTGVKAPKQAVSKGPGIVLNINDIQPQWYKETINATPNESGDAS